MRIGLNCLTFLLIVLMQIINASQFIPSSSDKNGDCSITWPSFSEFSKPRPRHKCSDANIKDIEGMWGKSFNEQCNPERHLTSSHNVLVVGDSVDLQLFHAISIVNGAKPSQIWVVRQHPFKARAMIVAVKVPAGGTILFCRDDLLKSFDRYKTPVGALPWDAHSTDTQCFLDEFGRFPLTADKNISIQHVVLGGGRHNFYTSRKEGTSRLVTDLDGLWKYLDKYLASLLIPPRDNERHAVTFAVATIPPYNGLENEVRLNFNRIISSAAKVKGHQVLDIAEVMENVLQRNALRLHLSANDAFKEVGPAWRLAGSCLALASLPSTTSSGTYNTENKNMIVGDKKGGLRSCLEGVGNPFIMIDGTHFCPAITARWGTVLNNMIFPYTTPSVFSGTHSNSTVTDISINIIA